MRRNTIMILFLMFLQVGCGRARTSWWNDLPIDYDCRVERGDQRVHCCHHCHTAFFEQEDVMTKAFPNSRVRLTDGGSTPRGDVGCAELEPAYVRVRSCRDACVTVRRLDYVYNRRLDNFELTPSQTEIYRGCLSDHYGDSKHDTAIWRQLNTLENMVTDDGSFDKIIRNSACDADRCNNVTLKVPEHIRQSVANGAASQYQFYTTNNIFGGGGGGGSNNSGTTCPADCGPLLLSWISAVILLSVLIGYSLLCEVCLRPCCCPMQPAANACACSRRQSDMSTEGSTTSGTTSSRSFAHLTQHAYSTIQSHRPFAAKYSQSPQPFVLRRPPTTTTATDIVDR